MFRQSVRAMTSAANSKIPFHLSAARDTDNNSNNSNNNNAHE